MPERRCVAITSDGLVLRESAPKYIVEDSRFCPAADFFVPDTDGSMM
ncbi:hypothetical protein [Megasphaera vaginalis (ex Srinivasan et al. 2021)]|nr:hypothetical protein [Megasphaera vaginalis (ex Srinivasan et al. 2021)]